ncbi:MAG: glycosyltransferase [Candidatus Taylorbacteria bacterium]
MDSVIGIPLNVFIFISLYFEVFLMITYLERRKSISHEETRISTSVLPTVSIIVPCFNEEKTISGTIESLLRLDYPKKLLKILVVDDGSTDKTFEALQKYESEPNIEILRKDNGGKYTALNLGLEKVTSELVGCLDADSYVQSDALKKIVAYFEDSGTMAVTPSIRVHNPKNILERIQNIEYSYGNFVRKMMSHMNAIYVTPGPFSIFRKEVFEKLGNYKTAHKTEDIEIALRMQSNKYKIMNCHKAFVDTITPKTLKTLYRQRLRWTHGFIKNAMDYRSLFFNKEHGNLGLLALPLAPVYILSALYLMFALLYSMGERLVDYIIKLSVIGFEPKWPILSFNWYFVNTDTMTFLFIVSIVLLSAIIILGHRFTEKKINVLDFFYTFTLYGLISPSWLLVSIGKVIFGKNVEWK